MNSLMIEGDGPDMAFPAFPGSNEELFLERRVARADRFNGREAFARHDELPGHNQARLAESCVLFIGAGGICSWIVDGYVRAGGGRTVVCDGDVVDYSNLTRQMFRRTDVGRRKVFALQDQVLADAPADAEVVALALPFEVVLQRHVEDVNNVDAVVCGVDNNAARLAAVRFGIERGVPVVFSMISRDAQRVHTFLQQPDGACLWCAKPTLDPAIAAGCVPAVVTSCFVAAAASTFFLHRALMGWPVGHPGFNWREADLLGVMPDRAAEVQRREDCRVCGNGEPL